MKPTHKCRQCGALWILHRDKDSWQLVSEKAGSCCDNEEMGEQIESLTPRSDAAEIINQDSHYGHYCGGDPRTFHPDQECCTAAEIENHRKACALWDEMEAHGEQPTPEACPSGWIYDSEGRPLMHVLRAPYGIGVQSHDEPSGMVPIEITREMEQEIQDLSARLRALEQDRVRLDWLEQQSHHVELWLTLAGETSIRSAIDAASASARQTEKTS